MGKFAVLVVVGAMIAGMHFFLGTEVNIAEAEKRGAEDEYEILARNAALVGLAKAEQMLSDDFRTYSGVTGSNDGGDYRFKAATSGTEVEVRSTGASPIAQGDTIVFNVLAKYKRRARIPQQAPPFMRYAVLSELDLVLRGALASAVYVDGDESNLLNANMHTNSTLAVLGNAALTKGFGTFSTLALPSAAALSDVFVPNHNPSSADHVYRTDPIEIPPFNAGSLASSASPDSVTAGDAELSGTYDLGTRENPYVWHVTGNLTATSNTTINGYALFYVEGDIDFRGNVQVGNSNYDGGDESSMAFYTDGNVNIRGNTEVWGQIFSDGNVVFAAGTPTLYGSITTTGLVDFRGTVNIRYRKASPALTRMFQPDVFLLDRMAYSEW